MKKRFLKLILPVFLVMLMIATSIPGVTTVFASALTTLASNYYVTNPNGTGKCATITIDGNFGDWSEDMLIAQGAAWDVANHYKGAHENCVLDTYSLYAAWDNNNLYVAWQMVNTTDVWAREGDGPLSDGGRILDVPLILALSLDESSISMSNKNTSGGSIWGQKMGITFDTHVDRLLYMSGKVGLGEPAMFKAVDSEGNTNYTDGCVKFISSGIEYKMAEGNISNEIWGLYSSETPGDVCSNDADWVDYKRFTGPSGTHNTKYDSFYEIKIPLATLGITKSDIESKGIGAMVIATRGESGLDCIPFDATMLDNATESYAADASTSHEKDDEDVITVPFARIGNSIITPPPEEGTEEESEKETESIPKKSATVPQPPKKGDVVADDKGSAKVEVSDVIKKEVTYKYPVNKKAKTATIPATVKINGVIYKVTKIADNAFKNNKTVTKIIIPSKVKKIGKKAFYGCKKLKTVIIKTTKLTGKNVGSQAFKGIYSKAKIKVPKSKLTGYKKILRSKGVSSKAKITK